MVFTLRLKNLPFERLGNQVIYTEREYNEKENRYMLTNYDAIKENFKNAGYEFIYLPKLLEELRNEQIIRYNAPYTERLRDDLVMSSDFMLQFVSDQEEMKDVKPSLVYFFREDWEEKESFIYKGVELDSGSGYERTNNLSNVLAFIRSEKEKVENVRFSISDCLKRFSKKCVEEEDGYAESALPKRNVEKELTEEDFDGETKAMIEEWKARTEQLKLAGVPEYLLTKLVYGEVKLSKLFISKDYRIFLKDYNNKEVELRPLSKSLFFLYLRHPEGIRFKNLVDYRDELLTIHKAVKLGFYHLEEDSKSITSLCNPTTNSASEKCAHIKYRFLGAVKELIAKNYYIEGPQGKTKKIALPRDLVVWEKPI